MVCVIMSHTCFTSRESQSQKREYENNLLAQLLEEKQVKMNQLKAALAEKVKR